jgi:hypothetical protein
MRADEGEVGERDQEDGSQGRATLSRVLGHLRTPSDSKTHYQLDNLFLNSQKTRNINEDHYCSKAINQIFQWRPRAERQPYETPMRVPPTVTVKRERMARAMEEALLRNDCQVRAELSNTLVYLNYLASRDSGCNGWVNKWKGTQKKSTFLFKSENLASPSELSKIVTVSKKTTATPSLSKDSPRMRKWRPD